MPKQIATLPPIEELHDGVPLSPRTGEPRRPAVLLVAAVILYLVVPAVAFAYGWHWYRAAFQEHYPISSHIVQWLDPEPGKWLSLTLEFVHAGVAGLAAAAAGVVGFHAWNGHRWTRWGVVIALALNGLVATLTNLYGLIGVGLVVAGAALLFLPRISYYFREWDEVRAHEQERYRRPATIHYGRLPRFR